MNWGLVFRIRQGLKGSLWALPLVGGLCGFALSYASVWVERLSFVPAGWDYSADTALTVLTTVVGATVGLTGFVVTVSVLVVQMATGTFSARYMRLWYRDGVLKATLAVLLGTLIFAYSLLRRIDESVPDLGVTLAGFFLGLGLLLFLVFLDRFVHRLRPVKVADLVARSGRKALRDTVDLASTHRRSGADAELRQLLAEVPQLTVRSSRSGAIQAVDDEGLLDWATHHDAIVVMPHGIGDFVSSRSPILEVHASLPFPALAERRLAGKVALGIERTIDQDPAFAIRILVDSPSRPAVNDPTTAIQVLDHLEDTLARRVDAGPRRPLGVPGRRPAAPARDARPPFRGHPLPRRDGDPDLREHVGSGAPATAVGALALESSVLPSTRRRCGTTRAASVDGDGRVRRHAGRRERAARRAGRNQ